MEENVNEIDRETAALLGILEMLNDQTEKVMGLINRNLRNRRSTQTIDRQYGNKLNLCMRWAKMYEDYAEKALMHLISENDIEAYDSLRKAAQDFLCLNLICYEYLTDSAKLNTILRAIQRRKTRRHALRDATIRECIIR